ncbi:MAG: hypothetical protein M3503_01125 [Actinomycetota bacterium]|nr:hypothetical protein [Actinomycetota bacterium]
MKALLVVLLAAATVGAIVALRETTMTRHTPVDASTEMEVVLHASSNVEQTNLGEMVEALFVTCQLQVATNPTGPPTPLGDDTYLLGMSPALDESDQRQLVGCLEDAVLNRLQASVVSISEPVRGYEPRR